MPLDPSIISSYNPGAGIDVNALMQQRMQGMENINALERQRKADDIAMQDRAAAQQKAQADAAVKALLPAYAYGFQNPSDPDGMLALVPADQQEAFAPYIEQIRNKSPEQVIAALTGSLVTSETGRAFLENQARMRTAQIQQGQLEVSREDINLRRQKQALDARGEGAWELKEGVDKNGQPAFMWVNPRTRATEPLRPGGGGAAPVAVAPGAAPGPTPIPAPDVVTPRMPEAGVPVAEAPISTAQPPGQQPQFRPKPKEGKEITQEERRRAASVRYTDKNASRVAEIIDKNPAAFGQGADEFLLSIVPFDMGKDFLQFTQDSDREQVYYRMTQIVATLLRLETGAAYTTPELVTESASFMPKYGDDPATARDKIDALQDRVTSAVGSTGRAWTPQDQAEYDAAMMALEAVKDRLYPGGGGAAPSAGGNEIDTSNPLLQDLTHGRR
jgi:hypothetical protein